MMNQKGFYMEPILFINDEKFLAGTREPLSQFDLIIDPEEAKKMLFEQELPDPYVHWGNFFSDLISDIVLDKNYKPAQKDVLEAANLLKKDTVKENIRKRKAYLLRKKNGLAGNEIYDNFLNDVSDEAIYMLNMVATQRYIYGEQEGSMLEEIYKILRHGCLPCNLNKDKNIFVIFNPVDIK